MEVPAPEDGVIGEIRVKVGDKVTQGDVLATYAGGDEKKQASEPKAGAPQTPKAVAPAGAQDGGVEIQEPTPKATTPAGPAPKPAADPGGQADFEADILVLGAGPGGYTAAFRAADLGQNVVLVDSRPTLGGVCLNVGCIPSKALLHVAKVIEDAKAMGSHGVSFGAPTFDPAAIRGWKDGVVKRLTSGLTGLAKQRKVKAVTGVGEFTSPKTLRVETAEGARVVRFNKAIIAAGSEPAAPGFIPADPRIWDFDRGARDQFHSQAHADPRRRDHRPRNGDGLSGARRWRHRDRDDGPVDAGADLDIVTPLAKRIGRLYDKILLKTKVTAVQAEPDGLKVSYEGPDGAKTETFDAMLVSVGRRPNGARIGAPAAGVAVDERGYIAVDRQMRTNVPHIFAIGDIVGQPMLAHKATHEAKVAAEVASGHKSSFDAKAIPSVAYTDPEVAWAGLTETEAKAKGVKYGKAVFPWAASGRSLSLGRDEGLTKTLWDEETKRLIGCGIVGPNAGDLISEAALAIEMGAEAEDVGLTIHPHPTLSETFAMSAEAFAGTLTDLYIPKKK